MGWAGISKIWLNFELDEKSMVVMENLVGVGDGFSKPNKESIVALGGSNAE